MSLKVTRNILSFILTLFIVLGGVISIGSLVAHSTIASQRYAQRLISDEIVGECKQQFEKRIDALEVQSGIPARVFTAVYSVDRLNETLVDYIYNGGNPTLYNEERINEFERLCKEYLDGNSIRYKDEEVRATAVMATEIYSDCFGMKNSEAISDLVSRIDRSYQAYASFGFMLVLISGVMFLVLYTEAGDIIRRIFAALSSTGLALMLSGIMCLVLKIGQHSAVYPSVYADMLNKSVSGVFAIITAIGFVLAFGFFALNLMRFLDTEKKNRE